VAESAIVPEIKLRRTVLTLLIIARKLEAIKKTKTIFSIYDSSKFGAFDQRLSNVFVFERKSIIFFKIK